MDISLTPNTDIVSSLSAKIQKLPTCTYLHALVAGVDEAVSDVNADARDSWPRDTRGGNPNPKEPSEHESRKTRRATEDCAGPLAGQA